MIKFRKLSNYTKLLIKYEILKREDVKHLKKIGYYEVENKTLRVCLIEEEKRTAKFRSCYKDITNEYENLANDYQKLEKEKKSLERKIKKLEKEIQKNDI